MSSHEFKSIAAQDHTLKSYACGLSAGSRLRIKRAIRQQNHKGKHTGKIYPEGEIWIVLPGLPHEPDIIWLQQADGEDHTWDADSIFETFEHLKT